MRKILSAAAAALALAASLSGCATRSAGYAYAGGYYYDECGFGQDCYGGYQYTCVFIAPNAVPARMDVTPVRRSHSPRHVNPRFDGPGIPPADFGSTSSTASASAPAPAVPREPVVVAAPAVDRGSPRTRN